MDAWSQIASWPVDATSDDTDRYFFITREAASILGGECCLVVGGKGTGKTALSRHLESRSSQDAPCRRLGSNAYTFAVFISRAGTGPAARENYVQMWRHFILKATRDAAANAHGSASRSAMAKVGNFFNGALEYLRKFKFIGDLLGSYDDMPNPGTEEARTAICNLEQDVRKKAGERRIFIIFDELDDGYNGQQEYRECLRGLVDACELFARDKEGIVKPVVLLRDDIYDALPGGRKGKWTDVKIDLKWDQATIQRLLAFRIARSFDENTEQNEPVFSAEWRRLFAEGKVTAGSRQVDNFDYIAERTLNRPRDYICFVKQCARLMCIDEDGLERVDAHLLKTAERAYSAYFWVELIDLLTPYCNGFTFAAIEKTAPSFSVDAFHSSLVAVSGGEVSRDETLRELRTLSKHGVIRHLDEGGSGSFLVHKGLYSHLKLLKDSC